MMTVASALELNGIPCGENEAEKLSVYLGLLLTENRTTNLTAIRDPERAAVLHIADSLLALPFVTGESLLDVGSGGGLPAVPIAVMRPDIRVTALDSTEKKTSFISRAAKETGIGNLSSVTGRAEELGRDPRFREKFDTVIARAVSRLDVLCELCMPLVRPGGRFIAMKGREGAEETAAAKRAISLLGGEADDRTMTLYGDGEPAARHIIVITKRSECPDIYPRPYPKIKKSPL